MIEIAHVTDMHLQDEMSEYYKTDSVENTNIVIDDIIKRKIQYVFFTGDIGDVDVFRNILQKLKKNGTTVYFTLGNHDNSKEFLPLLSEYQKENHFYFSINIDDLQILFLNSGNGSIGKKQLLWLQTCLKNSITNKSRTKKSTKLLFIHHPVLACEETILDKKYPLQNRDEVNEILRESGDGITVFAGHYHNEYNKEDGKIKQFVSPSCQLQYAKNRNKIVIETFDFGYRIISVDSDAVNSKVVMFSKQT